VAKNPFLEFNFKGGQKGDKIIVVTYCQLPAEEARNYNPSVVLLDDANNVKHAA